MKNLYLLYGDEDYLIKEEVEALKNKYLDPSNPFGSEHLDATTLSIDQLINAICSSPMLSGKRMVIIDNFFAERKKSGQSAERADKIISALDNIAQDDVIVFYQAGSIDRRLKIVKYIEKQGAVKEFKPFAFWEQDKVIEWVFDKVKNTGKSIDQEAAQGLIDIIGTNLRLLDKEIEKLVTFIGNKTSIGISDIKSIVSSGEVGAFALSNSIRARKLKDALEYLHEMFKDKESPPLMIGMIFQLYRMLFQVKSMENKGMSQYEIAQALGAKPFYVKKYMENTRLFTLAELMEGIKKLHIADLKIKKGTDPRIELELLITDLCGQGK